ncbi:MAG: hypothetical protein NVS9B10_21770 [Nevskia sp.]
MKPVTGRSAKNAWRPSWKEILGSPVHLFAFGLGTGLSPVAPGTVGTLVGIPLWYLLSPLPMPVYFGILGALFLFGCWLCGASARRLGVHDYGGIVFDEVVGFLVTCIPLLLLAQRNQLHEAAGLAIAFVAFRVFDIWKPWPIGWLDRRVHGGVGIMLDDLVAGVYAALVLAVVLGIVNDPEFR